MLPKSNYLNFLKLNEKKLNTTDVKVVVAFYKFFEVPNTLELQNSLRLILSKTEIKGTILIAKEGINGTIAGKKDEVTLALEKIWDLDFLIDLEPKYSFAYKNPFFRMKIRQKKEIVTIGLPEISPNKSVGKYIKPENWNDLLSDKDLLLIDTRNSYEVSIGSFENSLNPKINSFREFPDWVTKNLINKDPEIKNKKVAMFCTGGIRCEKSTSYLKSIGFDKVYHLEGGILKYLEKIPKNESKWKGSCFVFDYRVSVDHNLELGHYEMCFACRMPISSTDKMNKYYVKGESCHHCFESSNEKQKKRFKERQKQIEISRKKDQCHIGQTKN
jgi:UPF0176 protein